MRIVFALLLFLHPFRCRILAQESPSATDQRSVRVHGESMISAAPDEAEMDIGIVTQAPTMDAASSENAQRVKAVVEALRALIPSGNIKTVNLSINPDFRYPKEGAPVIHGYTANNTVRVSIDDLSTLRPVITAATKSGATSVNRLNFTLRSATEREVRAKALGEAAHQAEAGADALASSLKLKLGRVLQVEEGQPVIVSPPPQIELDRARSSDMTPLSPGYIQVHANVNLVYEILENNSR